MTLIDKISIFIFSILLFSSLYVTSTMNALHEDYVVGIEDFKTPFYIVRNILAVGLLFMSFVCIFTRRINYENLSFCRSIGISAICVPMFVAILGYAPCLYKDTFPPSELINVIKQSFFCPNYSMRSYVWIVIIPVFGLIILGCANIREIKLYSQNN